MSSATPIAVRTTCFLISSITLLAITPDVTAKGGGSGRGGHPGGKTVFVTGYYRADGTYVHSYYRSPPGTAVSPSLGGLVVPYGYSSFSHTPDKAKSRPSISQSKEPVSSRYIFSGSVYIVQPSYAPTVTASVSGSEAVIIPGEEKKLQVTVGPNGEPALLAFSAQGLKEYVAAEQRGQFKFTKALEEAQSVFFVHKSTPAIVDTDRGDAILYVRLKTGPYAGKSAAVYRKYVKW